MPKSKESLWKGREGELIEYANTWGDDAARDYYGFKTLESWDRWTEAIGLPGLGRRPRFNSKDGEDLGKQLLKAFEEELERYKNLCSKKDAMLAERDRRIAELERMVAIKVAENKKKALEFLRGLNAIERGLVHQNAGSNHSR